jgi:predicted transport protein
VHDQPGTAQNHPVGGADLKLFRIDDGAATELEGSHALLEKHLQRVVETNMETLLGVRFLASEYSTGERHGGRIDSLGIDEYGSPVIVEYKRTRNDNVITQGLYYLSWLMDHRAEFQHLVRESPHTELTQTIDWSAPRLICIATDYSRFDRHAVEEIGRTIDLVSYRLFGDDLLSLTPAYTNTTDSTTAAARRPARTGWQVGPDADLTESKDVSTAEDPEDTSGAGGSGRTGLPEKLEQAPAPLRELFDTLSESFLSLGDDVSKKTLKHYVSFRRLKFFGSLKSRPVGGEILVMLKLDPDTVELREGYTRDVRGIGHHGVGDLEVRISSPDQLDGVHDLIRRAYENG